MFSCISFQRQLLYYLLFRSKSPKKKQLKPDAHPTIFPWNQISSKSSPRSTPSKRRKISEDVSENVSKNILEKISEEIEHSCNICDNIFESLNTLENHIKNDHGINKDVLDDDSSSKVPNIIENTSNVPNIVENVEVTATELSEIQGGPFESVKEKQQPQSIEINGETYFIVSDTPVNFDEPIQFVLPEDQPVEDSTLRDLSTNVPKNVPKKSANSTEEGIKKGIYC